MNAPLTSHKRRQGLDMIRGLVMILMAIDHVRVYSGLPAGGTDLSLFFTRWITNFCAPAFVFFAGTSAFLYGIRINDRKKLRRFLVTRGILLILLEFTLIKFFWTFNLDYKTFVLAGVIWMLGCCMILLSCLIELAISTIAIIGLMVIFGQQLFAHIPNLLTIDARESIGRFWEFIYPAGLKGLNSITILYVLVPWIGVMATGYAMGLILLMEEKRRNKLCLQIGLSASFLFIIIATIVAYQMHNPKEIPFILRLLNQQKYPASELFLLMTLGPCIALLPWADRVKGWLVNKILVFGKVPLFYYLMHIPIIHLLALCTNIILFGDTHSDWYRTAPYVFVNPHDRWSLGVLYLIFVISVLILYALCSQFSKYKESNKDKVWLSYL